jgi:hypothetical protein
LEEASGDGNGGGFGGPEEVLHRLSSVGEEVRIREPLMSTQRAYFVINYCLSFLVSAFGSHVRFISFLVACQFCQAPIKWRISAGSNPEYIPVGRKEKFSGI